MSAALTFDTLMFFQKLEEAGFTRPQAQALAEAQKTVISEALDTHLATKGDMVRLERCMDTMESGLKLEMSAVRANLASLEDRMSARLYQAVVLQTFALAALFGGLKLLS